jgi:hypothetical protein
MLSPTKEKEMAREFKINPNKTYATRENAVAAAQKFTSDELRYIVVCTPEGRFYPVFVGASAIRDGVHFQHCVVA